MGRRPRKLDFTQSEWPVRCRAGRGGAAWPGVVRVTSLDHLVAAVGVAKDAPVPGEVPPKTG